MLKAGGLLDQPAGDWFSIQWAGWVWSVLRAMNAEGFKEETLNANDLKLYEQIRAITNAKPWLKVIDD